MSTATINYSRTLVVVDCFKCAIVFAVPDDFDRINREHGRDRTWFCPNGHGQVYAKSKLQEQRDNAMQRLEWAESARVAAQDQADTAERRRRAAVGQVTKIKKRVANGVCPCCKRTFQNVARHMAGQHPGYEQETTS